LPTVPWRELLDPDRARRDAVEEIDLACPLLREIASFGTHAFAYCAQPEPPRPDEALAPLRLYEHVIEMTDAIEILLREACATAAAPLLRSQWEANLQLVFMTAQGDRFGDAALVWYIVAARETIASMRQHVDHVGVQKRRKKKRKSLGPSKDDVFVAGEARKRIEKIESGLQRPHLAALAEIATHPWYDAFGGGSSIEQLAAALRRIEGSGNYDRLRAYGIIYRGASKIVHASDFDRMLKRTEGAVALEPIRSGAADVRRVASLCAGFALESTMAIVHRMRPELRQDLAAWYVKEVQDSYLQVSGAEESADPADGP
jgi:hypothetical protein